GTVLQRDGQRGFSRVDRILKRHVPSVTLGWRAETVDGAAAGADQRRVDLFFLEQAHDAIDGVPFGDAAEIELDAGLVETNRSRGWIQRHVRGADVTSRRGEIGVRRQPAVAAEEAPRFHQRTDGDVERAV